MRESFVAQSYVFYHWSSRKSGSKTNLLIKGAAGERCITVEFNDDDGFNNSRITTGDEPVGEGEES